MERGGELGVADDGREANGKEERCEKATAATCDNVLVACHFGITRLVCDRACQVPGTAVLRLLPTLYLVYTKQVLTSTYLRYHFRSLPGT